MRVAVAVAVAAAIAFAAHSPRADDPGEIPLAVAVGAVVPIGPGPVRQVICDDVSVVQLLDTDEGPALKGLSPGQTLCSLVNAASVRVVYRVTVVGAPPGPPPPPPPGRSG